MRRFGCIAQYPPIIFFMRTFRIEAVDDREESSSTMPKPEEVCEILKRLSMICSGAVCDLALEGEFGVPRERTSEDRIFRVKDFEGTLNEKQITIYLDSCRKVVRTYLGGNALEELIRVVLIHELVHLITHRMFELETQEKESDHLWEYTAQCATYACLKGHGHEKALKVFDHLSSHQPFIHQTWEGLKIFDRGGAGTQTIRNMVRKTFRALFPEIFTTLNKGDDQDEWNY